MLSVFLSYARRDHIFAELAFEKLNTPNITLWRDMAQIRGGDIWEHGIENAIARSHMLLVALSNRSSNSSYVTYEWAYGIGKGKPVIPVIPVLDVQTEASKTGRPDGPVGSAQRADRT